MSLRNVVSILAITLMFACTHASDDSESDDDATTIDPVVTDDDNTDDDTDEPDDGAPTSSPDAGTTPPPGDPTETGCSTSTSIFSPFRNGTGPTSTLALLPWRGWGTTYPAANEDFRGYSMPSLVECGTDKTLRSHLEVTSGCLDNMSSEGNARGRITSTSSGAFRVLALGFDGVTPHPVKWTDQSVEYRFFYTGTSGAGVDPGFKVFARYRTEYDLYVASWRVDGVVQIKKKICGQYTTLAQRTLQGPSTGAWHHIRFVVQGTQMQLFLDGAHVLSASDSTISSGAAGIRTDAMTGALLDDWKVQAP